MEKTNEASGNEFTKAITALLFTGEYPPDVRTRFPIEVEEEREEAEEEPLLERMVTFPVSGVEERARLARLIAEEGMRRDLHIDLRPWENQLSVVADFEGARNADIGSLDTDEEDWEE